MTDKVGLTKPQRQAVLNVLFSRTGEMNMCNDVFEGEEILANLSLNYPAISRYIEKIKQTLLVNLKTKFMTNCIGDYLWTNNNAESMNHILKQMTGWKSKKLLLLVKDIEQLCSTQYGEVRKAFVGAGEFHLHQQYKKAFLMKRHKWMSMTEKEKQRKFTQFLLTPLTIDSVVQGHDGAVAVEPSNKGKKPCQRKRRVSARTTTYIA